MRRAARRDANDGLISEALRAAGFTVMDFGTAGNSIPDKLVVRQQSNGKHWIQWVEIKSEKGKLREGQAAFRDIFEPREEYYLARDAQITVTELMSRYLSTDPTSNSN